MVTITAAAAAAAAADSIAAATEAATEVAANAGTLRNASPARMQPPTQAPAPKAEAG